MSLKHYVAVAGIAAFAAACSEMPGPFAADVQKTIDIPGNTVGTAGCTSIDLNGCFAILDNQLKILYERNNWAARRGEAVYRPVTNSNNELASVFKAESRTSAEAVRYLDRFINQIAAARDAGDYGECWGAHIQEYAEWIRAKITTANLDMSDAPQMTCFVTPVTVSASSGNTSRGVVLTIDDPWHYTGDPYGVYTTNTYFVVEGPHGTITTVPTTQTGAATVTIADPQTVEPGTHRYSIMQCADWGRCSEPYITMVDVVVVSDTDPPTECAHDNRNKTFVPQPQQPKCAKEIKLEHPSLP